MTNNFIQLLITGGTLDKDYNTLTGELVFTETHLKTLLMQANSNLDIKLDTLMLKDSLEMKDSDRKIIVQACINTLSDKIVITHGTDTMVKTALYLQASKALSNKCIVLTGAMRPFQLGQSDASFNLGSALMACQLTNPGVFIAMNGKLFNASSVKKNLAVGQFESL